MPTTNHHQQLRVWGFSQCFPFPHLPLSAAILCLTHRQKHRPHVNNDRRLSQTPGSLPASMARPRHPSCSTISSCLVVCRGGSKHWRFYSVLITTTSLAAASDVKRNGPTTTHLKIPAAFRRHDITQLWRDSLFRALTRALVELSWLDGIVPYTDIAPDCLVCNCLFGQPISHATRYCDSLDCNIKGWTIKCLSLVLKLRMSCLELSAWTARYSTPFG
ncbi:hypothetical protein QBC39DRAFT_14422 [Podospora conica]|nr:hypothetical protein QBC39DRAFT_14422 [Schizothecium conicum]